MFEYRRLDQIFEATSGSDYVSVKELCANTGVTDRTIRKDITTLNDKLHQNGAKIKLKHNVGYYLEVINQKMFNDFLSKARSSAIEPDLSSTSGRLRLLVAALLESNDYISLEDLADRVFIGESAAKSYLRQAKRILERYGLECVVKRGTGVRVFGREVDRRECFVTEMIDRASLSYATGFTDEESLLFADINLEKLSNIVKAHLRTSKVAISDYGLKNLLIHYALMLLRINNNCHVEDIPTNDYPNELVKNVNATCNELEEFFALPIPIAERAYIEHHLISVARVSAEVSYDRLAYEKVNQIIEIIQRDYGYDLRGNSKLWQGLFNHLNSVLRSMDAGAPVRNPLLNTIKARFPLAFEISILSTREAFSDTTYILDEDNIGYIALHVGAAIETVSGLRSTQIKTIIVCSTGAGSGELLHSRIVNFFGDKVQVTNVMSYQAYRNLSPSDFGTIDLVISTVPINDCPVYKVMVGFDFSQQDIRAVAELVDSITENGFSKIAQLFSSKTFMVVDDKITKYKLLEEMCQSLIASNNVGQHFFESTLERESVADTSMNDVIAIPHTMKPEALRTGIAVAILKQPMQWSEIGTQVKIVFLLAIQKGMNVEMEHLYDLLVKIVGDVKLQKDLCEVTNFDDFLKVIADTL